MVNVVDWRRMEGDVGMYKRREDWRMRYYLVVVDYNSLVEEGVSEYGGRRWGCVDWTGGPAVVVVVVGGWWMVNGRFVWPGSGNNNPGGCNVCMLLAQIRKEPW